MDDHDDYPGDRIVPPAGDLADMPEEDLRLLGIEIDEDDDAGEGFAGRVRDALAAVVGEFEREENAPRARRVIRECKVLLGEARRRAG